MSCSLVHSRFMMENWANAYGGESKVAKENKHFDREDRSMVIEENYILEKASETPPHLLPDSHADRMNGVHDNGTTSEPEEFSESRDQQLGDEKHEEQGMVGLKNDASTNAENFDEDIDRKVPESDEKIITCYEWNSTHGVGGCMEGPVPVISNSTDIDGEHGDVTSETSTVEIKTIIEDCGKNTSQKKYLKQEIVTSNWPDDVLHEGSQNDESIEVTSVKYVLDSGSESSKRIAYQHGERVMEDVKDVSVQSAAPFKDSANLSPSVESSTCAFHSCFSATNGHNSKGKEHVSFSTRKKTIVDKEDRPACSHVNSAANDCMKELKVDKRKIVKKLRKECAKDLCSSKSEVNQDVKIYSPWKRQREPAKHLNRSISEIKQDAKSTTPSELPSTPGAAKLRGRGSSSHLAGAGSSASLAEPSASSRVSQLSNGPNYYNDKENDEILEKLQMIRVKFLRLAQRLGQGTRNAVVAQVLYRLGLAEQLKRSTNRQGVFRFDRARVVAEQLEAAGQQSLDFSCTIMVIGKTGAGKSATINSILDDAKLPTDAFQLGTKKVQEVAGKVQGIDVRFIDTPGLFFSSSDQENNAKVLRSVKKFINKSPPDIVLYFDRLDLQCRDYADASLLRTITNTFGASIWFNAIVVLTHAASAPPEGPTGSPLSYEMFINQRSHVVQQAIHQAAGDVRLMNPVSLVENHSACRTNRAGLKVLPNGQVWKPQLLLLSFASKILADANMLLNLQDSPPGKQFGSSPRVPPLPLFLSSLLQSRPQAKLPEETFDGNDDLDDYFDATDSDEDSDFDELPPFKHLTKATVAKLSKPQKRAYFAELDYREVVHYKGELKEEKRRRKHANLAAYYYNEVVGKETSGFASPALAPMQDFVVPNSFDSYNHSHRYRYNDSPNKWSVKPVADSEIWDHDIGYGGMNVAIVDVVKGNTLSVSGHLSKNMMEHAVQIDMTSSIKHSESRESSLCLDMQTLGNDVSYAIGGESRIQDFRHNDMAAGISLAALGNSVLAGLKFEDKWMISKILSVLMTGGAIVGTADAAYGGRFEAKLRDKDYPIGEALSTFALSLVNWHGESALGCDVQSEFPVVRRTKLIAQANLNNSGTGQVSIGLKSSEHLQIVLLALLPIVRRVKDWHHN